MARGNWQQLYFAQDHLAQQVFALSPGLSCYGLSNTGSGQGDVVPWDGL